MLQRYRDHGEELTEDVDGALCLVADAAEELRSTRLWHWRRYLWMMEMDVCGLLTERADEHLAAVQTLNQFFDIDDTADKDAK